MTKKVTTVALVGLLAVSGVANASASRWNGLGLINTFVADVQDIWTLPTALLDNGDSMYVEYGTLTSTYNGVGAGVAANTLTTSGAWGGVHSALGGGQIGLWTGRGVGTTVVTPGQIGFGIGAVTATGAVPAAGFGVAPVAGSGLTGVGFVAPTSDIDLFYGMSVNDNTQIAIGINKSSGTGASFEYPTLAAAAANGRDGNVFDSSASGFGVSLGLGMSEAGPLAGLWAGLSYWGGTSTNEFTSDDSSNAGVGIEASKDERKQTVINVRVAGEVAGENDLSHLFDLAVVSESNEDTRVSKVDFNNDTVVQVGEDAGEVIKNSALQFTVGAACLKSGEAGFAASGLLLQYKSVSDKDARTALGAATGATEYTDTDLGIAWAAGGEVKAKEWLTVRGGISGDIFGTNSREMTRDALSNGGGTALASVDKADGHAPGGATASVGFGVGMGDFMFDAVLNQDFLYGGPYFLSGTQAGLGSQVSLTYGWGGEK